MDLKKRLQQMKDYHGNLPKLEELYYYLGYDIGLLNDNLKDYLIDIQMIKRTIKDKAKSIAEFNREFELTEQYIILKTFRYQIKAIEKMMAAIRLMVEALRLESRGQY